MTGYEERTQAHDLLVRPGKVAEEHRTAMAVRLARINYGLGLGNFVIDLSDDEVRFKASIDFGGAEPTGAAPPAERDGAGPVRHVASGPARRRRWCGSRRPAPRPSRRRGSRAILNRDIEIPTDVEAT